MITINFENTYDPIEVAPDLSYMTFNSFNKSTKEPILIKILKAIRKI